MTNNQILELIEKVMIVQEIKGTIESEIGSVKIFRDNRIEVHKTTGYDIDQDYNIHTRSLTDLNTNKKWIAQSIKEGHWQIVDDVSDEIKDYLNTLL